MQISVIIPVYNAENTLCVSLESVFSSTNKPSEVIVVDDSSSDKSIQITTKFPVKLIRTEKNSGAGYARDIAVKNTSGDLLVFIDADVKIKKDTIDIIVDSFKKNQQLDAVIGLFSKEHPNHNFFSQYKNLYMHFVFSHMPTYVDFLFTSICAIKKESYLGFSQTRLKADDTELGQRYNKKNKKILLNKKLLVTHLKSYNLLSLAKNDFIIPYDWARIFLKHKGLGQIIKNRRFAHAKLSQTTSILVCPFVLFSLVIWRAHPAGFILAGIFLGIFLLLNIRFFVFLYKERGALFTIKSIFTTYIDALIMDTGILSGWASYLFIHKKRIS